MRKPEGRPQSIPLARISPNLGQTDIGQFEVQQEGAASRAPSNRPTTVSASGSANRTAASAEASTTLMTVTVGADNASQVGRRLQAKAAHLPQKLAGA